MGTISKWLLLRECSAAGLVRYTSKARRVVFRAHDEALRQGSHNVTPEHFLAGILEIDKSIVSRFHLPPNIEVRRTSLESQTSHRGSKPLRLSAAAKQAMLVAAEERERRA